MIALLALTLAPEHGGIEAVGKAADACDRAAMSRAWTDEVKRRSGFVVSSLAEQRAIADARAALTERRRKLRVGMPAVGDTDAVLQIAGADLDDRQRVLDDAGAVDRMQAEAVGYFRQRYLTECGGRR